MAHSYFDDEEQNDGIDPEIKKELCNNETILPENTIFEG
jgi:hypothetical protein|tara:strand:+ start:95 stop:211 length:117 start_codon:yes stop_codon:yes gene_type:complete